MQKLGGSIRLIEEPGACQVTGGLERQPDRVLDGLLKPWTNRVKSPREQAPRSRPVRRWLTENEAECQYREGLPGVQKTPDMGLAWNTRKLWRPIDSKSIELGGKILAGRRAAASTLKPGTGLAHRTFPATWASRAPVSAEEV
jgi:hypothetical protein